MASFGGETPVNAVSIVSTSSPSYTYTVPTGRYAKISTVGAYGVANYSVYITIAATQYIYTSTGPSNMFIALGDLVLRAGDSITIQTGGAERKTVTGIEYNLP